METLPVVKGTLILINTGRERKIHWEISGRMRLPKLHKNALLGTVHVLTRVTSTDGDL